MLGQKSISPEKGSMDREKNGRGWRLEVGKKREAMVKPKKRETFLEI